LVIALVGVEFCISRQAIFFGKVRSLVIHGTSAVSMGLAWISVASFLHFHYFWGNHPRLEAFSDIGKVLSALAFLAAFGYCCFLLLMR